MEYVDISIDGENKIFKVEKGTDLLKISQSCENLDQNKIVLAKINNQIFELTDKINNDCQIEFLDTTTKYGFMAYRRSLIFILICATKNVLGETTNISVKHSIDKNYYCEIENFEITEKLLLEIKKEMLSLINQKLNIEKVVVPLEKGQEIFEKYNMTERAKSLKYYRHNNISFYKLNNIYDYLYGEMVDNTSKLGVFDLSIKGKGFIVHFQNIKNTSEVYKLNECEKIFSIFKESSNWAKILGVDTVGALNTSICEEKIKDIILISEAFHEKKIAEFANTIVENNKKIVLIAGPSSSGKTTFANRVCIQLKTNGVKPYVISLDNYYLNREDVPLDEFGNPDFERLDAIDVEQINKDLTDLVNGETIQIPSFNFKTGKREYKGNYIKLHKDEALIIEGIHGLNDRIAQNISKDKKFKIFISALTQLNIDTHNRISATDCRLIRRMVRDHNFRGFSANSTITMWSSVNRGENKYIFPFQEKSDVMFNSALVYELAVLNPHVKPLLYDIEKQQPEYIEATRLIRFLENFLPISCIDIIPSNSIIREFIGGSCFE